MSQEKNQNVKLIKPAFYLQYCPTCGQKFSNRNDTLGGEDTVCECGYSEPAGNAPVITFLSQFLVEYAKEVGITHVVGSDDRRMNLNMAFESSAALPLLASFASQMKESLDLDGNFGLKSVAEHNSFLGQRTVIDKGFNLGIALHFLADALHQVKEYNIAMNVENKAAFDVVAFRNYVRQIDNHDSKAIRI